MGAPEIADHIAAAALSGRFREIGISGGEPFLFPSEVLAIVRAAHGHGLGASVTTNAFWARTEERARGVLEPLVAAGLTSLAISVSSFHLEYTRAERLANAARAAVDAGLDTRVNVVVTSDFSLADARRAVGSVADRATFVPMPCIPAGRAESQVPPRELPPQRSSMGNCAPHFTKLAVTPVGDVYPCCSPGGFTAPLRLGNIRENGISEIVRRMESSLLHQVLEALGPAFFLPFLEAESDVASLSAGVVDQCHLCHSMFSDEAMTAVARAALERLEDDLRTLDLSFSGLLETA